MRSEAWYSLLIVAALAGAGCRHASPAVNPYVKGRPPEYHLPDTRSTPRESGSDFAARVRRLQAEAAAVRSKTMAPTLESTDADLRTALAALAASETAENHRTVAARYLRAGVRDTAMEHYTRAIRLAPNDAASYEMCARIWRMWGFPDLGLADAHRARYYAPRSASVYNTLGTLLQGMGRDGDARSNYERALALDPDADYARRNLAALTAGEQSIRVPEGGDAR